MPEPTPPRHRVLDWNPASAQVSAAPAGSRRQLKVLGAVAGLSLVVAALAVAMAYRVMTTGPERDSLATLAAAAAEPVFVSQARAELTRDNALRTLVELRKLPPDHPALLQQLILVEKNFMSAERTLASGDYALAVRRFDEVNRQIEEFTATVKARKDAGRLYDELLVRLKNAERFKDLAMEDFDRAFEGTGQGRSLMEQGSFLAAWQAFEAAAEAMDSLEARRKEFVDDHTWKGAAALAAGDRAGAERAYRAVLRYEPGQEEALRGLRRAETIERVHALVTQAQAAEERQDYEKAIESYAAAFKLDPLSVVAQQGEARAKRLRDDSRFDAAVAAARAAAERLDWTAAVEHYDTALAVYPKREEIVKARADAAKEGHTAKVRRTLARAYDFEREYKWPEAQEAYLEVLRLEKGHPDATEGLIRVGRTIRALVEFEKLVEIARSQAESAQFQPAIRSFNAAMALKPAYLPLSEDISQLRSSLEANSEPVEIRFKSDGRTWVSISNFRLLGRIREETVKILPGDYEIVGRRKGYRDVMLLLRVRNGMNTREVTVICNERAPR
jgi:tetratricopeptide (TPR) repeat protein